MFFPVMSSTSPQWSPVDFARMSSLAVLHRLGTWHGSTNVKNTVCHLLKFYPPSMNHQFTIEFQLITHRTWQMHLNKSSRIKTLSCNEGSMRLRPEGMSLKSSEMKNFLSWRISTVLKPFLVSSASCHCALPHVIRPTLSVLKFIPKIIYQSPEFDRSIFFSK